MKNFDEFSKGIKINESEMRFLNEEESVLADLGSSIITHLEDNDIKASYEVEDDSSLCIEVGGEDIKIKKEGEGFVISSKHNKDEKVNDADALISWWASFVPQHKAGEAEYKNDKN